MSDDRKRVDQWTALPGETADLGWGLARLNADGTLTRTCKACGASATGPTRQDGEVLHAVPIEFEHKTGCLVWELGIERYLGRS